MDRHILKLTDYHISETCGFLLPSPLQKLPEYFHSWNHLSNNVEKLCVEKQMRSEVEKMPCLDHCKLKNHREYRLAHLQLCFIGAGYIWQNGEKDVPRVIPKCLALPWFKVSEYLGVKPIVSHISMALANWKLLDPEKPLSPSNVGCIMHLPGGNDARIFFDVAIKVEVIGTGALKGVEQGIKSVMENDRIGLTEGLRNISKALISLKEVIKEFNKMDPNVFYNVLRPFLAGWKGDDFIHKGGLVFEGANNDEPIEVTGASAAQSSLLQVIDAALDVRHDQKNNIFFHAMRDYMPPPHREFIKAVEQGPSIKRFVEESSDETLSSEYNSCLCKLRDFRSYHIQLVTRTVVIMARKHKNNFERISNKGTGGQDLIHFLKDVRNSTTDGQVKIE